MSCKYQYNPYFEWKCEILITNMEGSWENMAEYIFPNILKTNLSKWQKKFLVLHKLVFFSKKTIQLKKIMNAK